MSVLGAGEAFMLGAADDSFTIQRSLRFDSGSSSYLSRTPSSAGNRKTWTWSGWVKRSKLGTWQMLLAAGETGSDRTYIAFVGSDTPPYADQLSVGHLASGIVTGAVYFNPKLRDCSAYYHIVVSADLTNGTANNRLKAYINGVEADATVANAFENTDTQINNTVTHQTKNAADASLYVDGYLADVHFIDGQALAPTAFGAPNADTGVWEAKKFTGTYTIPDTDGSSSPFVFTKSTPAQISTVAYLNSNPDSSTYPLIQSYSTSNNFIKVKFSSAQASITSIKFRGGGYSAGATYTLKVNGTQVGGTHSTNTGWVETTHSISSTNIQTLEITGSDGFALGQLKFNNTLVSGTPSYGTLGTGINSFALNFSDNSSNAALGTDSSGNSNTWTVNNIIAGKESVTVGTIASVSTLNSDGNWSTGYTVLNSNNNCSPVTSSFCPAKLFNSSQTIGYQLGKTNNVVVNREYNVVYTNAFPAGAYVIDYQFAREGSANMRNFSVYVDGVKHVITTSQFSGSVVSGSFSWTQSTQFSKLKFEAFGSVAGNAGISLRQLKLDNTRIVDGTSLPFFGRLTFANNNNFNKISVGDVVQTVGPSSYTISAINSSGPTVDVTGGNWYGADGTGTSGGSTTISTVAITNGDNLIDTPTNYTASPNNGGNYATWNALTGNTTLSNGNLDSTGKSGHNQCLSTIGMSSGKYYCEITITDDTNYSGVGIGTKPETGSFLGNTASGYLFYSSSGNRRHTGVNTSYGSSFTTGDIIGIAFDADGGNLYFYKNGTIQDSGTAAFTGLTSGPYFFAVDQYGTSHEIVGNFGQRPFAYTPPTGYSSLVTTNLSEPTIADPSTVFDVALWAGNSSTQTISGLNLSPDFVWIKVRSDAISHYLGNTVAGINKNLESNNTAAEVTNNSYGYISATTSDGFSLTSGILVNGSGKTYVGWAWDVGTSNTTIAAGGLNSSVYNQSYAITSNITSSGLGGTLANWFNGQRANKLEPSGSGSLDFTGVSALQNFSGTLQFAVSAYSGSTSMKFVINASTDNLTFTTNTFPSSSGGFPSQLLTIPVTSLRTLDFTSISGQSTQFWGMYLNGKLLVDSTATPDNVPTIASTVRANPSSGVSSGVSIVSYQGNGSTNQTVAHGLNQKPSLIIYKDRDSTSSWRVIPAFINDGHYLELNSTAAITTGSTSYFGTNTSSVLGITGSNSGIINANGNDIIAYCFAPVNQFSSFGSYEGNSNADGTFIYTGFKIAFLLIKKSSGSDAWIIWDNARQNFNAQGPYLQPQSTTTEGDADYVDFLSNGFKWRTTNGAMNASGSTYIYAAFAENPFSLNGGLAR